ncbi:MAG: hypothetical protein IJB45_05540 [Clostridia bacterium]|nr:hypothetical protein [Clostridia bacterium]
MTAFFMKIILFLTMIIMIIQAIFGNLCGGKNPPAETTTMPSATITETTTAVPTQPSTLPSESETTTTTTTTSITTTTTTAQDPTTTYPVSTETTTKKPTTTKKTTTTETGTRFNTAAQAALASFGGKSNDIFAATDATSDGGFVACGISTSTDGTFQNVASSNWAINFAFVV